MDRFSHVDQEGRASMVDVSGKKPQLRVARAAGRISMARPTAALVADNAIQKGDVLAVAEIAGVQAAKRTAALIPLCHPVPITDVKVRATLLPDGVAVTSEVRCVARTGVEMEALTATSIALLTVYDMCKAVDKGMVIESVVLLEKSKTDLAEDGP